MHGFIMTLLLRTLACLYVLVILSQSVPLIKEETEEPNQVCKMV